MKCDLLFPGLVVEVETSSERLFRWLDSVYQAGPLEPGRPNQRLRVCVEAADSQQRLDIEPVQGGLFAEVSMGLAPCHYQDGRFYSIADGEFGHVLEYEVKSCTLRVNLGAGYLRRRPSFVHIFFCLTSRSFLFPLFRLTTLHGALLTQGAQTVMLMGNAGAGKSTATLQLMRDGYAVMADDSPLFTVMHDEAVGYCSPEDLRVTPATLERVPGYHAAGETDYAGKYALPKRGLPAASVCQGPRVVTDIVLLHRQPCDHPKIRSVARREMVGRLVGEAMVVFRHPFVRRVCPGYSEFLLDVITRVVAQARAYELTYADEHLEQLAAVLAR